MALDVAKPLSERVEALCARFRRLYGREAERVFRAPGRINIIGEHTDYNEGFVLPAAVNRCVLVAVRPRSDRQVRAYSVNLRREVRFHLDRLRRVARSWANYVRGVAWALQERGARLPGVDMAIESDVPIGGGLSSSAALEVAAAYAWMRVAGLRISRRNLALLCRKAENEFVGVPCGIMDQFASAMGRRGRAVLLDCRSLEWQKIVLDDRNVRFVVADTGVRRALASSEYAVRRRQCEEAVGVLQSWLGGIGSLRDVSHEDFQMAGRRLRGVLRRRARHVLTENARVHQMVKALKKGDWEQAGALMDASHESLRSDYEVSSPELDALVGLARDVDGVYGSRLMGGGFGGCTISIVEADALGGLERRVAEGYEAAFGRRPSLYACTAEAGASELQRPQGGSA